MKAFKPTRFPDRPHIENVHMRLEFKYNARGFGDLRLMDGDRVVDCYLCRTGSINSRGKLVNAIKPETWYCIDIPVSTTETGMYIHEGHGWKCRLYRQKHEGLQWTHYLIHPDGGRPGSKGCIVILGTDAGSFRLELENTIMAYGKVPCVVEAA